jgi:hypothetical protein
VKPWVGYRVVIGGIRAELEDKRIRRRTLACSGGHLGEDLIMDYEGRRLGKPS